MDINSINLDEFFKAISNNDGKEFRDMVNKLLRDSMNEYTKKSLAMYIADRDGVDYETAYDVICELQWQFNELIEQYNGDIPISVTKQLLEDWLFIKIFSDEQATEMAKPFL